MLDSMSRLYRRGGSRGPWGWLYALFRKGAEAGGQNFSSAILRRAFENYPSDELIETVVVSHPILVGVLPRRLKIIYQHGELVAPRGALVEGADEVLVPTEKVAEMFVQAGYLREQIFVSGLCIEPGAVGVAVEAYRSRHERIDQTVPLIGLFVSSGAEPYQHVKAIISSVTSCNRVGIRTIVLARQGGKLETEVKRMGHKTGLQITDLQGISSGNLDWGECSVIAFRSNLEESQAIGYLLPQIDFFVGPPHERTNWALGLGLPMFALTPCIGPFAPLNMQLLESSGTTVTLGSSRDAEFLGETVTELRRTGQLGRMAECGWGNFSINGFERIAEHLLKSA